MQTTTEKLERGNVEFLMLRLPIGTKDRIEEYRRSNGFRSMSEVSREFIFRGLVEADI